MKIENSELKKCLELLKENKWGKLQNDISDSDTNFIYYINTVDLLKQLCEINGCDFPYALNRFYAYWCSKQAEQILCDLGAKAEPNKKEHDIDIYISDIAFDVKLTILPQEFDKCDKLNLRENKNKLIEWYIANASKENRAQECNRLYIVCSAPTYIEKMALKQDGFLIAEKCKAFLEYYKNHDFNHIVLENGIDIIADAIIIK